MTREQLLAQAAAAERQAAAIFASVDQDARQQRADVFGGVRLVPKGRDNDVQRAGDLMREARALRDDAASLAPLSSAGPIRLIPPATRPPSAVRSAQEAGTSSLVDEEGELDSIADRIAAA